MYARTERNLKIKELYESGTPRNDIAKQFGISPSSVSSIAKQMGANTSPTKKIHPYEKDICFLYQKGHSAKEILSMLNLTFSENTIIAAIKRNGIEIRPTGVISEGNHYCFHSIANERAAYFLGLMTADGNVMLKNDSRHSSVAQFGLDQKDRYLVEAMNRFWGRDDSRVNDHIRVTDGRTRIMSHITICSDQICKDLISYGCVPNKSKNLSVVPDIDERLLPHYIRGFFDGNGTAFVNQNNRVVFGFYSTPSFTRSIYEHLVNASIVSPQRKVTDKPGVSSITFMKICEIQNFRKWIYTDATIWCERKRTILESQATV